MIPVIDKKFHRDRLTQKPCGSQYSNHI